MAMAEKQSCFVLPFAWGIKTLMLFTLPPPFFPSLLFSSPLFFLSRSLSLYLSFIISLSIPPSHSFPQTITLLHPLPLIFPLTVPLF